MLIRHAASGASVELDAGARVFSVKDLKVPRVMFDMFCLEK